MDNPPQLRIKSLGFSLENVAPPTQSCNLTNSSHIKPSTTHAYLCLSDRKKTQLLIDAMAMTVIAHLSNMMPSSPTLVLNC